MDNGPSGQCAKVQSHPAHAAVSGLLKATMTDFSSKLNLSCFQRLYAPINGNTPSDGGKCGGTSESDWDIKHNINVSTATKALMAPTWLNAPEMGGTPNHYVRVL